MIDPAAAAPAQGDDRMLDRAFTWIASKIAFATGQPAAFVLASLCIIVWGLTGPLFHYSDTWQLVVNTTTTIITFLMVFLVQNSQNRDAAAMQAKLDELIRALDEARGQFIGIEHKTEREIEKIRADLEKECADSETTDPDKPNSDVYLDNLIRRR